MIAHARGVSYQIQARSSAQILHDDPQFVTSEETSDILCDVWTRACAQHRYFLLNFENVVLTRLQVDLY
jgi:hypothetical protein